LAFEYRVEAPAYTFFANSRISIFSGGAKTMTTRQSTLSPFVRDVLRTAREVRHERRGLFSRKIVVHELKMVGFFKKGSKKEQSSGQGRSGAGETSRQKKGLLGSPARTTKNENSEPSLNSLNIVASDDLNFEVLTPESQRALIEQREVIRKKLFENSLENSSKKFEDPKLKRNSTEQPRPSATFRRTATEVSQEVFLNGRIQDTPLDASRFSIPITMATSFAEVRSAPYTGSAPVSVDVSFTESELGPNLSEMGANTPSHENKGPQRTSRSCPVSLDVSYTSSELASLESPSPSNRVASASPSSQVSMPMDEQRLEISRNKGKSPIKTPMPDDERAEYQGDEFAKMESPFYNFATSITPEKDQFNWKDADSAPSGMQNFAAREKNTGDSVNDQTTESMGTDTYTHTTGDEESRTTRTTFRGPEFPKSLLNAAFQCSEMFLEKNMKNEEQAKTSHDRATVAAESITYIPQNQEIRRPAFFDESTALRFLRRITNNGFVLLYLQPPEVAGDPAIDWNGRTVTLMIARGTVSDDQGMQQPRLEWSTVAGGLVNDRLTCSVGLLEIHSISSEIDGIDEEQISLEDGQDLCFFTITTIHGDVHIFESATKEERDRIITGLKTVLARLTFHVIAGDTSATSELFSSHAHEKERGPEMIPDDELPLLPNPSQTMNLVAQSLLDL
jgi:hypothetical protein